MTNKYEYAKGLPQSLKDYDSNGYSTFYANTFTDESITNTRNKLSSAADELFLKTELEAQAGAKIVFWSELNGAVLKQDELRSS